MSFTVREVERAAASLKPWVGAQLQGAHQPEAEILILSLRRPGESLTLAIHCRGARCRIQSLERRPANPAQGAAFQQLCRKELRGRLTSVEQVRGDRILTLRFEAEESRGLIVELTGRHGNAFVVDGGGVILGSMLPNVSTRRALSPGQAWTAPLPHPSEGQEGDRFEAAPDGSAFLEAVGQIYGSADDGAALAEAKGKLGRGLRAERKRLRRLAAALEGDMTRAAEGQGAGRLGDLIQIHLNEVRKGMSELVVDDLFQEPSAPIRIPLAPELSPKENMARCYALARRYQGATDRILERAAAVEERQGQVEGLIQELEAAQTVGEIDALAQRAGLRTAAAQGRRRGRKPEIRLPYQRYTSSDGFEIRVGRGARDNDALTFRHAKGNDFWLHVRGGPGAHVVIPCPAGPAPLTTLIEAAALALKYGGKKVGDDGEVAYTRAKFVRRAPGGEAGRVTFSQDKSLHVRLDEALLGRIHKGAPDQDL